MLTKRGPCGYTVCVEEAGYAEQQIDSDTDSDPDPEGLLDNPGPLGDTCIRPD